MEKYRMKKAALLSLIMAGIIFLTGCPFKGPQYTEEALTGAENTGIDAMEEWLRERYPIGRVIEAEPYVFMYPSGPSYLTDFVTGTIFDGERERDFSINVADGNVTLEADDEMWDSFLACAKELYLESLDFAPDCEVSDFSANIIFDKVAQNAGSGSWGDADFIATGLPGDMVVNAEDVEAFVRNPDRGYTINVNGRIRVDDSRKLSDYTGDDLFSRAERWNLNYGDLHAENMNETMSTGRYERWDYDEWEGRKVWTRTVYRSEEKEDGVFQTKLYEPDVKKLASLIRTEDGYQIKCADDSQMLEFNLYVQEGDELLEHEYNLVRKDMSRKVQWVKRDEGWTLENADGSLVRFYATADLVPRE